MCLPGRTLAPGMFRPRQLQICVFVTTLVLLAVITVSAKEQAICSLVIQGHGAHRQGVEQAKLQCNTTDGASFQVGVDSTIINETNSAFVGVEVPKEQPDCQTTQESGVGMSMPAYSLLYFCDTDYNLTLHDVRVENVHYDGDANDYYVNLVYFGDGVSVHIINGSFTSNSVRNGDVLEFDGVDASIVDSLFVGNNGSDGTAIWAADANVSIGNTNFQSNTATLADASASGVVHLERSNISISSITMRYNAIDGDGTISLVNSIGNITGSVFAANRAHSSGALSLSNSSVVVSSSVFVNNVAVDLEGGNGGAIWAMSSTATLTNSSFRNNTALWGAAVDVDTHSVVNVAGCTFLDNVCVDRYGQGWGGVFYVQGILHVENITARGNSAAEGGVVYGADNANITVSGGSVLADNHASSGGGGAVILYQNALLMVHDSTFANSTADTNGGAVVAADHSKVYLKGTVLMGNSANTDGSGVGGAISTGGSGYVEVADSILSQNSADTGGGVYADGQSVLVIDNCNITHNRANTTGGLHVSDATLHLRDNVRVRSNVAAMFGGGLGLLTQHFNGSRARAAAYGNSAKYDADISVLASNILLADNSPNKAGQVANILSDGSLLYILNVTGMYGFPCEGEYVAVNISRASDQAKVFDMLGMTMSGGALPLTLRLAPGDYNVVAHVADDVTVRMEFPIQLAACALGQVLGAGGVCQACPRGSYSLDPDQDLCAPCPTGADCPGGATVVPGAGFWHSTALSDQVHRCPNPSACTPPDNATLQTCASSIVQQASRAHQNRLGSAYCRNTYYPDLQCSGGYQGNLCGVCSNGYGSTNAFTCRKCMDRALLVWLYVLGAVALLGFVKALCHFTLAEAVAADARSLAIQEAGDGAKATDLLKPLVLYLQYFLVISTLNIEWPESLSYPFKALAVAFSATSPQTLSVDCLFTDGGLPTGIKKVLFYLLAPLVMLAALLVVEFAAFMLRARTVSTATANVVDRLTSSAIVLLFFFLPSIARTTFSLFACVPVDRLGVFNHGAVLVATGSFWVQDLNQQCFRGWHLGWSIGLGLPLLCLFCIGLPGAIFFLTMCNRRHMLPGSSFSRHYGFLFRTYKPSCCFWEGVIALQTIGLVALSVFGNTLGAYHQVVVTGFALQVIYIALVKYRPYAQCDAQIVMEYGVICLLLTTLVALTLLPEGSVQDGSTNPAYKMVMGVVLVVLNVAFIAFVG